MKADGRHSQTCVETDISIEKPIKSPFCGIDMFAIPPMSSCSGKLSAGMGLGSAGRCSIVGLYAAAPVKVAAGTAGRVGVEPFLSLKMT